MKIRDEGKTAQAEILRSAIGSNPRKKGENPGNQQTARRIWRT
jgi:hypothetical protein